MTAGDDALSTELVRLEGDIDEVAGALKQAKTASRDLRAQRRTGRSYRDLLLRTSRPRPLELVRKAIDRLRGTTGRVRRAEMGALRSEGVTLTEIARRFGISHQRVSKILKGSDTQT